MKFLLILFHLFQSNVYMFERIKVGDDWGGRKKHENFSFSSFALSLFPHLYTNFRDRSTTDELCCVAANTTQVEIDWISKSIKKPIFQFLAGKHTKERESVRILQTRILNIQSLQLDIKFYVQSLHSPLIVRQKSESVHRMPVLYFRVHSELDIYPSDTSFAHALFRLIAYLKSSLISLC